MARTTKEKIEVMTAYEEGKKIELYDYDTEEWRELKNDVGWDWIHFDYRVKEEPKYRPYKDTEEMINDFCERSGAKRSKMGEPFIWVKYKAEVNIAKCMITSFTDNFAYTPSRKYSLSELFDDFTYCDGSPIGKKE